MEWMIVSIYTSSWGIDTVCNMLSSLGIDGVEIEDEQDFKDFLEENKKYWDYVDDDLLKEKEKETRVKVYLENNDDLTSKLDEINNALMILREKDTDGDLGRLAVSTEGINEEDWANNWKQYFHPIPVGEKILIQPQWEPLGGETDRTVFTVNPGMTFGTGTHHTTKLCIEELEKCVDEDTNLLDIGCGSGILSVISLLLGAKEAWAVDIDPACEKVAMENAELNSVDTSKYHVYSGDIISDKALFEKLSVRKYDVIAANIVADVIIALLPIVKKLIKAGGTFVCSGIIDERLEDVLSAMDKENITPCHKSCGGGWNAMTCKM
ncbi:MAG: 50S ribosomal protein L11 methyltransferase [Clostridia bacterium]|nr:50S ribosomal protein L11 methyltransferase [Clostridia bacterium]